MGQVQNAAQQATFAVDDFFQQWSATGSSAMGLRGAGNNLTMLAASLGGIKTQLAVIAGISIGQLLLRQFEKGSDGAQALNEELSRMSQFFKHMTSLTSIRRETVALQGSAAEFRNRPAPSRADVQAERDRLNAEIKRANSDAENRRFEGAQLRGDAIRQARYAIAAGNGKIDPEIAKRLKGQLSDASQKMSEAQMLENQAKNLQFQQEQLNQREQELQKSWFRDEQAAGDAGFKGFGAFITNADREVTRQALEDVTDELNSRRAKFSMADMFRMMPSLNTMGSAGAISAINAAQIGPQNARDSGPALQRQQLSELKRIRELEEKKKGLLEVVGL